MWRIVDLIVLNLDPGTLTSLSLYSESKKVVSKKENTLEFEVLTAKFTEFKLLEELELKSLEF